MVEVGIDLKKYGEYHHNINIVDYIPRVIPSTNEGESGLFWINHENKYDLIPNNSIIVLSNGIYNTLKKQKKLRKRK